MQASYFTPEVHSPTFENFNHMVCGVSWGAQCGGMCTVALRRFYDGSLIDCESGRSSFEGEIWDAQFLIVSKDGYKSCNWDKSESSVSTIIERVLAGKPTLLYLDQEDWSLTGDHFVIAYAIKDEPGNVKRVFIYDPNCTYKKHYCNLPGKLYGQYRNLSTWLDVDYNNKTVTKNSSGKKAILGFKAYSNIHGFTHEKKITHACAITRLSIGQPQMLGTVPVISHRIKVSKSGNVPADLRLVGAGGQSLYEDGDNIYTNDLIPCLTAGHEHVGLQFPAGAFDKTWTFHEAYSQANWKAGAIAIQSNFVEAKLISMSFPKPEIDTFTASANSPSPNRQERGYASTQGIGDVFVIQGLKQSDVIECEELPANYGRLPVNRVSFAADDYALAIASGAYDMFKHKFYIGYVKSNVVVEVMHNGLYQGAKVRMTTSNPPTTQEQQFANDAVVFTLAGGDHALYSANAVNYCKFTVAGQGINAGFSDTIAANLQYRCLIIHEPAIHNPHLVDMDVFAKYFEDILIHIPHTPLGAQWDVKFRDELKKHPRVDERTFAKQFRKEVASRLAGELRTLNRPGRLRADVAKVFRSYEEFRNERTRYIVARSRTREELDRNFQQLENLMRGLTGRRLAATQSVASVFKRVFEREWK